MIKNSNGTFSAQPVTFNAPIGPFYSPSVAIWFERLAQDVVAQRARRMNDDVVGSMDHYRALNEVRHPSPYLAEMDMWA